MNLPEDYQNKMQKYVYGDEYLQYLDSFNYSYGQTLLGESVVQRNWRILTAGSFDGMLRCSTDFIMRANRIIRPSVHYAGVYYLQEPSAMALRRFTSRTRR